MMCFIFQPSPVAHGSVKKILVRIVFENPPMAEEDIVADRIAASQITDPTT